MKNQNQKAFTLVELIVVITILAILGTIAFINLQGYTTEARDSKRISDINNIQKKIAVEESKGIELSNLINLSQTNAGLIINSGSGKSIQGTANFQTLKENGENFRDPKTNGDYILSYSVGGSGTGAYKFTQIATINEENNQAVVKGNYYQMKTGDSPSLIKDSKNNYVVNQGIDLVYDSSVLVTRDWIKLDPNCDIPDIKVGTQIWAGCNSTLGNGFEWGQTNANIGTNSYSGTVVTCYDYNGNDSVVGTGTMTCTPGSTAMASNSKANSWYNGTNINGDTEYNTIWGKLYTWNSTAMGQTDINGNVIQADNNTICPAGWHVPSDKEWEILETTLNGGINCRNATDGLLCDGLGWKSHSNVAKNNTNNLTNALKIPLTGSRNVSSSGFKAIGYQNFLWSSTLDSTSIQSYVRNLNYNDFGVYRLGYTHIRGFSVRCIKD